MTPDARTPVALDEVLPGLRAGLAPWVVELVESADVLENSDPPESVRLADAAEVADHFVRQVARTAVAVCLRARVDAAAVMRELDSRAKGGWLLRGLRSRRGGG